MKPWIVSSITIVAFAAGWLLRSIPFNNANSTTQAAHRKFDQHAKKIILVAESMPSNKYAYGPAYSDDYFLGIVNRVESDTLGRCDQLVNIRVPAFKLPPIPRPSTDAVPEEFKNDAVKTLKETMDLCDREFLLVKDSQLHELVSSQRDQKVTKAEAMMDLLGEVAKAESEMDIYFQLSSAAAGIRDDGSAAAAGSDVRRRSLSK